MLRTETPSQKQQQQQSTQFSIALGYVIGFVDSGGEMVIISGSVQTGMEVTGDLTIILLWRIFSNGIGL